MPKKDLPKAAILLCFLPALDYTHHHYERAARNPLVGYKHTRIVVCLPRSLLWSLARVLRFVESWLVDLHFTFSPTLSLLSRHGCVVLIGSTRVGSASLGPTQPRRSIFAQGFPSVARSSAQKEYYVGGHHPTIAHPHASIRRLTLLPCHPTPLPP